MKTLEEVEKKYIIGVLKHVETYDEAARILGIDIATLYRKRVRMKLPLNKPRWRKAVPISDEQKTHEKKNPHAAYKAANKILRTKTV